MVLATIAAVFVASLFRVGVISPLLFTAAVFPFYYDSMKRGDHRSAIVLAFRWGVALFASLLIVGAFVPDRLGAALPLTEGAVRTLEKWVREPGASPPAGAEYVLWGTLAFLAGSFATGGLLGFLIGAVAVGGAAYGALYVFRHGLNIIQAALVAVPVWQLSLFVAGALLVVPASVLVFEKFLHAEKRLEDRARLRQYMYAGAGFFVLSLLLRYTVADAWRNLVARWTVI
jgi:membrane-anchored glycerophosphoryl diester phosphodiesterase (GDPDase)